MSSPTPTITRTTGRDWAPARRITGRTALVVGVPTAWAVVALIHPMGGGGSVYEELRDKADLWLGVHIAQLVLSVGLGAALWITVRGRATIAATLTRLAIPVYLVFFAAFDSISGIASALAIRQPTPSPARRGKVRRARPTTSRRTT